jgi:glycosyltransferase involved in cell wall biosynthesis
MLGWELPPHNAGGLGVACYHMCRALSASGADIDFIVPYTDPHDNIDFMNVIPALPKGVKEIQKAGIVYDSFKFVDEQGQEEWVNLFDYHKLYEKSIDHIVTLGEYDVIHAFDWLTIRPALRAKQLTGKPLIVNIHALEYDRAGGKRGNPLVWEIEYQGMMMADKVVTVSQLTKDVIVREYGIPADKIEVIHNSFDLNMYDDVVGENSYHYLEAMKAHGYKVVMFVGRLTLQKGLYNLIRAFARVVEKEPKTILLVVGSGEQEIELIELAAEFGIGGNVIFAGFQRGKQWRDAFGVSDLTAMPSISEPFGLTPFESAAFHVPALVSKQSGVAEVMRTALKVDFWDIDEMANQIVAVTRDDALQRQLSEDSYHEIQTLSWGNTARKFMKVYREHAGVGR